VADNTQPLLFSSLGRKKIQADFNGGSLTSDAGALLLRELDKRGARLHSSTGSEHHP
jgi:hypothetical protein